MIEGVIDGKDVPADVADLVPYKSSCPRIRLPQVAPSPNPSTSGGKTFTAGNGHASPSEAGHGVLWL